MQYICEALIEQARYFRNAAQEDFLQKAAEVAAVEANEFSSILSASPPQQLLQASASQTSFTDDEDLSTSSSLSGSIGEQQPQISSVAPSIAAMTTDDSGCAGGGGGNKKSILETLLHSHKQQEDECRKNQEPIEQIINLNNNNNHNNNNNEETSSAFVEGASESMDDGISEVGFVAMPIEQANAEQIIGSVDLNENAEVISTTTTLAAATEQCDGDNNSDNNVQLVDCAAVHNLSQSDLIVFDDEDVITGQRSNVGNNGDNDDVRKVRGDDDDGRQTKQNDLVKQVQIECSNNLINQSDENNVVVVVVGKEENVQRQSPLLSSSSPTITSEAFEKAIEAMQHQHVINSLQHHRPASPTIISLTPPPPSAPSQQTSSQLINIETTNSLPNNDIPPLTTENLKSLEHSASAGQLSKSVDVSSTPHPNPPPPPPPPLPLLTRQPPLTTNASSSMLSHHHPTYNSSVLDERSFSLESLNSETSVDSNDSKSSLKLAEIKFSKNGTLERQQQQQAATAVVSPLPLAQQTGLQVLVLWNNGITRSAASGMSNMLAATTTLEILNVGRNVLSNDFLGNVKQSLKSNTSLTSLGLQSAHLTCAGIKTLADILEFGGNSTLQRIDVRDNHLQVAGLTTLNGVLKSNKSVTRIDLDDVPRRAYVSLQFNFELYCQVSLIF